MAENKDTMLHTLNFDRDYLKWALRFFQQEFTAAGLNVTEANSAAILAALQTMPVRFLKDGTLTTVSEGTSGQLPMPVKISSATGDINITAGDLNVHLSDVGANFDRTRIGDGVDQLEVNTDGSINTVSKNFDDITGNSKTFTYYAGVEAGNPSGNKNVKTIVYAGSISLTKTFTYDAQDDVLTIVNS